MPDEAQGKIRSADRIIPYDSVIEIARLTDKAAQASLLESVLSGATVRQVREQAKEAKPGRAGKSKAQSTKKIATSKGWVIIHCEKKTAKKDDYVLALQEAMKAVKKLEV